MTVNNFSEGVGKAAYEASAQQMHLLMGGAQEGLPDADQWVRVLGPASLSNLGPGYDAIGLCIEGIGDVVEARVVDATGTSIVAIEGDGGRLPWEADQNTASIAAQKVLELLAVPCGLELRILKRVPFGSGIGGSAASAVAGAWAANVALGSPLTKEALIQPVLDAEAIASGGYHGDNVLPALFGGLVLVSSSEPSRYRRIALPRPLPIAVVVPDVEILTKAARDLLPAQVDLRDAAHNAAELAFLVDAFHGGDWETVGRSIMSDRLVEPVRATLLPCYEAVRSAALEAGAFGCAITGSGPAMFAIAETAEQAAQVQAAMVSASESMGIAARGLVTAADPGGVQACEAGPSGV